jgi:hypothetical protein
MPEMERWKQAHVALAGFAAEFAAAAPCFLALPGEWQWYMAVARFALYPAYAGEASGWKWV